MELEEYRKLVTETHTLVEELNAILSSSNTIQKMWVGINLQLIEKYKSIAEKTVELEKFCE